MTYHPTPNDPSAEEPPFNPDEQPTQRVNRSPNEQPTEQTRTSPAPQGAYPSGDPASSFYPQQQGGYPVPPEANTPPRAAQPSSAAPQTGAANSSHYGYEPGQPAAGRPAFWSELTLLGQVAGVAGLLLLIFFFLPWSFTPDVSAASTQITNRIPTTWHSGWSTAVGVPLFGGTTNFNIFPQLWLMLLCALALIVIAGLLGAHRISQGLATLLITLTALFALLLEIFFLVQINSFQSAIDDLAGGRLNQTLYGVSWGFWLALVATVVALGVGVYMLYEAYQPGTPRTPQAPRFPGDQQLHPTA